jgi:hypothetical protein
MKQCGMTLSEAASEWPEAIVSVKMTMNPYVYAFAIDKAHSLGLKPWEFINLAIWEKIGKPSASELTEFASKLETDEEDPNWLKRLKITAKYEVESGACSSTGADQPGGGQDADSPL